LIILRIQKSNALKLAPILAQYLHEHKKLDLVGIGTFSLDPSLRRSVDPHHATEGISFQNNTTVKDDEVLVSFISERTGKMKALASSDLGSYLELARQFLNIGKPFQIEGIGTLVKTKSGLEFTPDHLLADKVKETGVRELSATSISDGSMTTYENLKPHVEQTSPYKKIFLGLLVLATTVLIVWAGYKLYKTNSSNDSNEEQATEETIPPEDTSNRVAPVTDTTLVNKQSAPSLSVGTYRFVIETANKQRALRRYEMLKKGGINIQLSTTDSVTYKLFIVLPATPADTARIADSLTIWYPALNKKRAFAEQ
jgi:hypothetical protein